MEWKWVWLQVWEYSECLAEMDHACTLAAVPPVRVQWAPAETPQATIARSDLYTLHADCLPDSLLVRDSTSPLNPHALDLCGGFRTILQCDALRPSSINSTRDAAYSSRSLYIPLVMVQRRKD
jgi:hypothetical protein